jgi:hypothetical protein
MPRHVYDHLSSVREFLGMTDCGLWIDYGSEIIDYKLPTTDYTSHITSHARNRTLFQFPAVYVRSTRFGWWLISWYSLNSENTITCSQILFWFL